ncbi:MAG: hypothetical protein ACIAXF_02330, partial [Phycisphaerales bacterium JB063]
MPDATEKPNDAVTLWPLPDARHIYLLAAGIVLGVLLGPAVMGRVLPSAYEQLFNRGGYSTELESAREAALAMMNDPGSWLLSPEVDAEVERFETLAREKLNRQLTTLRATGVTQQAIDEHVARAEQTLVEYRAGVTQRSFDNQLAQKRLQIGMLEREQQVTRQQHYLKLIGVQMALVLALIAFAVAEALLAPPAQGEGRRVASPRLAHLVTIRYALLAGWLTLALAQPAALQQVNPYFAAVLVLVVLVVGLVPLGKR